MTREQAINYLISSGFTHEQVGDVVRALTYKPRDCANCKHYVVTDTRTNWGSQGTTKIYGCERWECEYEPTTKNNLGVDCISRAEAIKCLECDFDITGKENMKTVVNYINSAHDKIVNLPRVKQAPFKPMVEIDLDYVIKQKYIEREVLDKIRAEILEEHEYAYARDDCDTAYGLGMALDIIDKYKAESEIENESTN